MNSEEKIKKALQLLDELLTQVWKRNSLLWGWYSKG